MKVIEREQAEWKAACVCVRECRQVERQAVCVCVNMQTGRQTCCVRDCVCEHAEISAEVRAHLRYRMERGGLMRVALFTWQPMERSMCRLAEPAAQKRLRL